ncbi:hypothetical protein ScPMuIL_014689, partial [Solemya velum]
LRQRTHIAQKLPKDLESKVESFLKFVIDERKDFVYDLSAIGNMDETPMYFDMPGTSTIDFKGSSWVKNAWDSIKPEMVVKSFKKCGISNAMDGTEDDMLYDELVGGKADSETNLDLSDTTESMLSDYYTDDTWVHNVSNPLLDCCKKGVRCICNLSSCKVPKCAIGFESVLHRKGNTKPGTCCDQYVCQRSEKCASVFCPEQPRKLCPVDSFKLPSTSSNDGCCLLPQECQCHPCPVPQCLANLRARVTNKAQAIPGDCCDSYQCVDDTSVNCSYNEIEYQSNQSWNLDKCTTCTCHEGLTFCKAQNCNATICSWMVIPEGECCPVCKGCMSDSGKLYNNSDIWKENNNCVTCRCDNGQVQCQAEMCSSHCPNPRQIPGRCCPICDESAMSKPLYCPGVKNCTAQCPNGLQSTADNCFLCKCKPEKCFLDCKYGFATNNFGAEICACARPPSLCPSLTSCKKQCTYGYKKSRTGCRKCRCNKCPPFNCTKMCVYGYVINDEGCNICKCRDASHFHNPKLGLPKSDVNSTGRSCLSAEGHHYEDADTWHDGCRLCYCNNGQEMCSLIACPAPRCTNPIIRVGDCCPTCPGTTVMLPNMGKSESCQAANGQYYVEGETWMMDNCTPCICHDSHILCQNQVCPPLLCHYPVKHHNSCCPVCPDSNHDLPNLSKPTPRPCSTENGALFKHLDVWRTGPCQSCTCRYGRIHCFSQMCPITICNKTVLLKGQCCPVCIANDHPGVCLFNGVPYSSSEEWRTENCTECVCSNGESVCIPKPCPQLTCSVMVRPPGQCCPVCFNMSTMTPRDRLPLPTPNLDTGQEKAKDLQIIDGFHIAVAALSVVVFLLLVAVSILIYRFYKQRHSAQWKLRPEEPVKAKRPKSTNLDLQGAMPSFLDHGNAKQYNLGKLVLEKPLVSLESGLVEKTKLTQEGNQNELLNTGLEKERDCYEGDNNFLRSVKLFDDI